MHSISTGEGKKRIENACLGIQILLKTGQEAYFINQKTENDYKVYRYM